MLTRNRRTRVADALSLREADPSGAMPVQADVPPVFE